MRVGGGDGRRRRRARVHACTRHAAPIYGHNRSLTRGGALLCARWLGVAAAARGEAILAQHLIGAAVVLARRHQQRPAAADARGNRGRQRSLDGGAAAAPRLRALQSGAHGCRFVFFREGACDRAARETAAGSSLEACLSGDQPEWPRRGAAHRPKTSSLERRAVPCGAAASALKARARTNPGSHTIDEHLE